MRPVGLLGPCGPLRCWGLAALLNCWCPCRGVLHTPTGRPGTGRIHVPGYDHSSLAGCLGGVFNTPLHRVRAFGTCVVTCIRPLAGASGYPGRGVSHTPSRRPGTGRIHVPGRSSIRARGARLGGVCRCAPARGGCMSLGVHPFGPVGPVWGAYAIRPYTGYVDSPRWGVEVLGAAPRWFVEAAPSGPNDGTAVGAYCIRPPGAPARGEYTSPGVHPFGPVGPVWGAYSIRPTGRPGTGRMHVPGRSSIRARGPFGRAYAIRPYTVTVIRPVGASLLFRQMDVGIAVAGAAA